MNSHQLDLMLAYISNEIALNALRSVGMSWQAQSDNREILTNELRKSVTEVSAAEPNTIPDPDPDVRIRNKFSPLMIDMLLYAHHSGHNFHRFPSPSYPAQQQALEYFIDENLLFVCETSGSRFAVQLTRKGSELVRRILNTPMPE